MKYISLLLVFTILSACSTASSQSSTYKKYTDPEWGISLIYPSTMGFKSKPDHRLENGVNLSANSIQFTDTTETTIIFIQIVEDPTLSSEPGWYPPSDNQLKIFASGDIGSLAFEKTDENDKSIKGAIDTANRKQIGGYTGLEYRVFINSKQYGYTYIRGATVVSPKRSFSIMTIGGLSKENATYQAVKPERIDEIWDTLLSSLKIDY